jgi:hypothetical protein
MEENVFVRLTKMRLVCIMEICSTEYEYGSLDFSQFVFPSNILTLNAVIRQLFAFCVYFLLALLMVFVFI